MPKSRTRLMADALKQAQTLESTLKEIDLRTLRSQPELAGHLRTARDGSTGAVNALSKALPLDKPLAKVG